MRLGALLTLLRTLFITDVRATPLGVEIIYGRWRRRVISYKNIFSCCIHWYENDIWIKDHREIEPKARIVITVKKGLGAAFIYSPEEAEIFIRDFQQFADGISLEQSKGPGCKIHWWAK